jgi:hypothetical protein
MYLQYIYVCVCVGFVSLNLIYTVRRDALDGGSARRKTKVGMWLVKHLVIKPCGSQVTTDLWFWYLNHRVHTQCVVHRQRDRPHLAEKSGVPITSQIARCSKVFVSVAVCDMHVAVCAVCNHIHFTPGNVVSV